MMDGILKYRIFMLIILLMGMAPIMGFGAQQKNARVVLLDPAHGGEETGVLADKMREKDLTLQVALLLRDEAKKIPGLELRLTRSADRSMSVSEGFWPQERRKQTVSSVCISTADSGRRHPDMRFISPDFSRPLEARIAQPF